MLPARKAKKGEIAALSPETPRFLAKAGNLEEAKAVMVKLRGDEAAAQAELDGVIADIRAEKAAGEAT